MQKSFLILAVAFTICININAQHKRTKYSSKPVTISILGDSYSTFENYVVPDTNELWYFKGQNKKNDLKKVEETWWHQLIYRMGARLCQNNSYSGSTICCTGYGKADYTKRAFITRMKNLGTPDIILIFGATNDSWCNAPFGEFKYADWNTQDLFSFRPAMAYMLDFITKRYQNTKVYFILNSELKAEINNSVQEICNHYNVPVISLHNIDKQSGHPSIAGMKAISDQVFDFISTNQ